MNAIREVERELLRDKAAYSPMLCGLRGCMWLIAREKGRKAAIMLYSKLKTPLASCYGDLELAKRAIRELQYPQVRVHSMEPISLEAAEAHRLIRMKLDEKPAAPKTTIAKRVGEEEIPLLDRFYRSHGAEGWDPSQAREGVYYMVAVGGEVMSAAGTHCTSDKYSIAVVGNVLTSPRYRGRGYARAALSQLLAELSVSFKCITLDVRENNASAQRLYRKLGFKTHAVVYSYLIDLRKAP